MEPRFLDLSQVLAIHRDQVERYGGSLGLRDGGLLDAALAMPRAMFGGEYLHEDIYSMAAAYLFHLVLNHAFIDGNKRVGFVAAAVFLELNGIEVVANNDQVVDFVLLVAQGEIEKSAVAEFLRQNSQNIS